MTWTVTKSDDEIAIIALLWVRSGCPRHVQGFFLCPNERLLCKCIWFSIAAALIFDLLRVSSIKYPVRCQCHIGALSSLRALIFYGILCIMKIQKDGVCYGHVKQLKQYQLFIPNRLLKGTAFFCDSFRIPVSSAFDVAASLDFIEKTFWERNVRIGRNSPSEKTSKPWK